ncbi:hypothetical protein CBR_g32512 [Chara braunii]|uniref:DUF659 domain-containing protein n=1 Tax=Chara braunii TaxID=69332 RepID=A0A388LH15_CHABU|nr:hypothetical protein CBR_g32512 [Chara braunii]|eukprot:GBG81523.1 hypothetical protein CBR_g32512 [Chara braunii]
MVAAPRSCPPHRRPPRLLLGDMADEQQQEPFEEDMTCPRDHVVWSWVTPGQMLPGNSHGSRRLRCKICNKEYKGNRKRAWEHFILARASARCSGSNLSIWKRLHRIGAQLPPDLLARVQMALEQERDDDDDDVPDVAGARPAGERGGGGIVDQHEESRGGEGEEGLDEGMRGVVTGGSDGGGRPGSSQAVMQVARTRRPGRQTSIKRYAKNPRQEEIDDSYCKFFVENSIPFNAAKSRSFKKFTRACYGQQPAASHPLVPTGYNPLRCRLLDRLNKRLQEEEQAIRDDWQVTGCTFITDGTTDICGRSLMNYILAGRSKPIFINSRMLARGTRTPQPSLPDGSGGGAAGGGAAAGGAAGGGAAGGGGVGRGAAGGGRGGGGATGGGAHRGHATGGGAAGVGAREGAAGGGASSGGATGGGAVGGGVAGGGAAGGGARGRRAASERGASVLWFHSAVASSRAAWST